MEGSLAAQWVAVGLLAIGQLYTYAKARRNQHNESLNEAKMAASLTSQITHDIANIKAEIDNEVYGLRALHKNITSLHEATTTLAVQVSEHERRLKGLNNK